MNTQSVEYKAKDFEGRNLAWFFFIAMGIPYLLSVPFLMGILEWPTSMGSGFGVLLAATQFLPLIGAFLLAGINEGKTGIMALWKRFWNRDMSLKWLLVALLLNPAIRLVTSLIDRAVSGQSYPILIEDFIPAFLFGIIVGIREEFGWRGYVLPRFQAKWNALTSSLILGVIWASYHILNWFLPPGNPIRQGDFGWFALWIICGSIFTTWIFNNTNGSIMAAVLYHAATTNGLVNCCLGIPSWVPIISVTVLTTILVVVIYGPKTLTRQRGEEVTRLEEARAEGD